MKRGLGETFVVFRKTYPEKQVPCHDSLLPRLEQSVTHQMNFIVVKVSLEIKNKNIFFKML